MDGTWTSDPDVLATWLDPAKEIAVAVCNGRELEECVYLPLNGADEPERILTSWLADVPEGSRREAQVEYGEGEGQTESAFVTLRESSIRIADRAEAEGRQRSPALIEQRTLISPREDGGVLTTARSAGPG